MTDTPPDEEAARAAVADAFGAEEIGHALRRRLIALAAECHAAGRRAGEANDWRTRCERAEALLAGVLDGTDMGHSYRIDVEYIDRIRAHLKETSE